MKRRAAIAGALLAALAAYVGGRIVDPPNYIDVSDWFAAPIVTLGASPLQFDLSAEACGGCHKDSAQEWSQTMHAHVWDDAAFQADWRHQGYSPICRNCHTPLDRQQESLVVGFRGGDRSSPELAPNPAFDANLRQQGVTCAACHVRDGKVYGPWANGAAPHKTAAWTNPNETCVRCHLAANTSRVSFLRQPPCGTIGEIEPARQNPAAQQPSEDGYLNVSPIANPAALRCVECHMPSVDRPLASGGPVRPARRHLWRGGHDPATVRAALTINFTRSTEPSGATRYSLEIANTGANHHVPTGPVDRALTVTLQRMDAVGRVLQSQTSKLERRVLGRPFLLDLWDTRLRPNAPQTYSLIAPAGAEGEVEAVVRYWLMSPSHSEKLDVRLPISTEIFRERMPLVAPIAHSR